MGGYWKDSLATGVEQIDSQHRELLRRFDLLLDACGSGQGVEATVELLGFLTDYVVTHFHDEEEFQLQNNYAGYESHRLEHQDYINRLRELQENVSRSGAGIEHVMNANALLFKWIVNHIAQTDKELGLLSRRDVAAGTDSKRPVP